MNKKTKITIVIAGIVIFYFFLIFSSDLFRIEPIVFIVKTKYAVGETISVYGFAMQSQTYGDGCGPKLSIYRDGNLLESTPQACTLAIVKHYPLSLYQRQWDQKIYSGDIFETRIQVEAGKYTLEFMGKDLPIIIE